MRILVTGGAGFIGSNLADAFAAAGHEVIIIDNLSTGRRSNVNPKYKFYQCDIIDPSLPGLLKELKPDVISHHAAQIDVRKSVSDPRFDAKVNILGMINLLESAVKCDAKRVIFASSGGVVYGEPTRLPVAESHEYNPLSPYGASKISGEIYLRLYGNLYGLPWVALRYGNVYGPRQDPLGEAGVAAIFTLQMLKGEQTKIYGDGTQTRDFTFVQDIVNANMAALEDGEGQAINIGTGKGISVNQVFSTLQDIIGYDEEPLYCDPRGGELEHLSLDVKEAKEILGWSAQTSLYDGMALTVEAVRQELEQLRSKE